MMNAKRNSTFLMANLGSEITRLLSAREEKKSDLMKGAYDRSISIFNELYSRRDMINRRSELDILKQVIDSIIIKTSDIKLDPSYLKAYFMPFALRALSENKII